MADTQPIPPGRVIVAVFDGVGGPAKATMGADGFTKSPTAPGTSVIASCGKHSSQRYPDWSGIPWGTPMRENGGQIEIWRDARWKPLSTYSRVTKEQVESYYRELYDEELFPKAPDGTPVTVNRTWVFNDFGHVTCYLFNDVNRDGKRNPVDARERIKGTMLHTTPPNEADKARGIPPQTIQLDESHGCVNIKPSDIYIMIAKGYLKKGNSVVVHPYDVKAPAAPVLPGRPPFAFHFYPGSKKILIFGVDTARSRTTPTYRPPPRPGTTRRVQPSHPNVRSVGTARRP